MTVSRVLRNSPHVARATRDRVLAAVQQVGYERNAHLDRLMSMVRSAKQRKAVPVIGIMRDDIPEDDLHDPSYQYVSNRDIRERAARHGYRAEEFFLVAAA